MSATLTAGGLYEALRRRLGLRWVAGRAGGDRPIGAAGDLEAAAPLVGPLNFINPNRIQVLGTRELRYLASLGRDALEDALGVTLHGVFMEVMGIGVLITGEAAVGKSELALELITRGHRLIADDAPEFSRVAPDILSGTCPELLRDFLEVRGLAALDDPRVKGASRLESIRRIRRILGVQVPEITIPVAPGRNIAVLVEAAVQDHILRSEGYDAAKAFAARQRRAIERDEAGRA